MRVRVLERNLGLGLLHPAASTATATVLSRVTRHITVTGQSHQHRRLRLTQVHYNYDAMLGTVPGTAPDCCRFQFIFYLPFVLRHLFSRL